MPYTLWIYSKRQARWIELMSFADDELDKVLRLVVEFERTMRWAVISADGLRYWRKGDAPEEILKGIAMDAKKGQTR